MESPGEREVRPLPTPTIPDSTALLIALRKILNERLTKKQRAVLDFLADDENRGISQYRAALEISSRLFCSRSAVYNSISSMKRCGLVRNETGRLTLTELGLLLLNMEVKNDT